jgi:hypothetical protein
MQQTVNPQDIWVMRPDNTTHATSKNHAILPPSISHSSYGGMYGYQDAPAVSAHYQPTLNQSAGNGYMTSSRVDRAAPAPRYLPAPNQRMGEGSSTSSDVDRLPSREPRRPQPTFRSGYVPSGHTYTPHPDNEEVMKLFKEVTAKANPYNKVRRGAALREVYCLVGDCLHLSKTPFACRTHRDSHFPGRFRCPGVDEKRYKSADGLVGHLTTSAVCRMAAGYGPHQQIMRDDMRHFCDRSFWDHPGGLTDVAEEEMESFVKFATWIEYCDKTWDEYGDHWEDEDEDDG